MPNLFFFLILNSKGLMHQIGAIIDFLAGKTKIVRQLRHKSSAKVLLE
jgi:hypothetical protein